MAVRAGVGSGRRQPRAGGSPPADTPLGARVGKPSPSPTERRYLCLPHRAGQQDADECTSSVAGPPQGSSCPGPDVVAGPALVEE